VISIKDKIVEAAGKVVIIGVSLTILAIISYDSFLKNGKHSNERPIDF